MQNHSSATQKARHEAVLAEKKNLKKRIARLECKLKNMEEERHLVDIGSDGAKRFLKAAFDHTTSPEARQHIHKMMVDTLKDANDIRKSSGKGVSQSEVNAFASRLCKLMEDESLKLAGCDMRVRFDSRIKRLALSHFLNFGKTGYKN